MARTNYNILVISFSESCVQSFNETLLGHYDFNSFGGITKGYVPLNNLTDFITGLQDLDIINHCLIEINYDIWIQLDEMNCTTDNTTNIYYDGIIQPEAWHLDQLDQNKDHQYTFTKPTNSSLVDLWILDTGVNWKHREFQLNQVIDVDLNFSIRHLTHPHGTGTACAAGGIHYGSSKGIKVYSYPICRFGGSCGSIWADKGFIAVLEHLKTNPGQRSVINLSVGSYLGPDVLNSSLGQYYNGLFKEIVDHGGIVVTSAGNSNQDACTWIYSFSPYVISVGSLDQNYNKSSFSNYGSCVDIWSFGSNVPLAYSITDNSTIQFKSGTSFSSPLVAGLIANVLLANHTLTKEQILNVLYETKKDFLIPKYSCGNITITCCRGIVENTRLDRFCKQQPIQHCGRSCVKKKQGC